MNLFYKLLLPALFISITASAQRNFKPGYIVDQKGDTIRGTIDHRDWIKNPEMIQFKSADGKVTDRTPENTKALGVDGSIKYETYRVGLTNDEIGIGRVRPTYDSTKTPKTVFLKVLAKGKNLNLYNYTDKLKPRFLLSTKGDLPTELEFHIYLSNTRERAVYGFRGELMKQYYALNADAPALLAKIERAEYFEEELTAIVNALNSDNKFVEKLASEGKVRFFVGAGINSGKLAYSGFVDLAENVTSSNNILPQFNVGVDFMQNSNVGRWVVRGELSVLSGDLKASSSNASYKMKALTLAIKPQVLYNIFIQDKLKVFAGAGLSVNVSSYSDQKYEVTNNKYNVINGEIEPNSFWMTFPLKLGVFLNERVEIYGGYNFGSSVINNDALKVSASLNTIQGGLNILLGRK